MPDISKIQINDIEYDIKDESALHSIENIVSNQVSISNNLANFLGLNETDNIDYAFETLRVKIISELGAYDGLVAVTVLLPSGEPAVGLTISNLFTITGDAVVTNNLGQASGYGMSNTVISINPSSLGYIDLITTNYTLGELSLYDTNEVNIVIAQQPSGTILTYTSSGSVKLSKDTVVSLSLVGGGSGGDGGDGGTSEAVNLVGGAGGSGGKIYNITNITLTGKTTYSFTIGSGGASGAGGAMGYTSYLGGYGGKGSSGSNTIFASYTSNSGNSADHPFSDNSINAGGSGGAGGRGRCQYTSASGILVFSNDATSGSSGFRKGGRGGSGTNWTGAAGTTGSIPGGGGGGGARGASLRVGSDYTAYAGGAGGAGASGAVYIKFE